MVKKIILLIGFLLVSVDEFEAKRVVRVRPTSSRVETITRDPISEENDEPFQRQSIRYNAEDEVPDKEESTVVIAGRPYLGNRGRKNDLRLRADSAPSKAPPVETIRNFNKLNEDGSFTFGYEAADGSFKEETRGVDCVVRGKYGYIDPDGNKREFTYVSGNPCNPNDPDEDEDESPNQSEEKEQEENIPPQLKARQPTFLLRTFPTKNKIRPATVPTVFQQDSKEVEQAYDVDHAYEDTRLQKHRKQTAGSIYENNLVAQEEENQGGRQPSRVLPNTLPGNGFLHNRPILTTTERQPATTYRPLRPLFSFSTPTTSPSFGPTSSAYVTPPPAANHYQGQLKKFQLQHNVPGTPSASAVIKSAKEKINPIYSTELIFDPRTGQYDTIVYQKVLKSSTAMDDIGPAAKQGPYQSVAAWPTSSTTQSPQLYQHLLLQQQQAHQVQQSQQLYNLQQKQQQNNYNKGYALESPQNVRLIKEFTPTANVPSRPPFVQRFPPNPNFHSAYSGPFHLNQPYYYFNPAVSDEKRNGPESSFRPVEAFLRG